MKTRRYNTRSSSKSTHGKEKASSYQTIPFDVVIEILTRLPAKSIARFRCLSKQYASTLYTPNFTDSFFTISSSRPKLLFKIYKDGKMFFFSSPQPQNPSPATADFHMSFSINCPIIISRPVSGLVCGLSQQKLSKVTKPLICNPSTGQFLTLPRVKTRRKSVISFLGYDPIEKQHKVLCMTKPFFNSEEHQVLTLETGKKKPSWRMIKCDLQHSPCPLYDGICINGVCYYLAILNNGGFPDIVCFDIRFEKFSCIKRAHKGMDINTGGNIESTLVNYKGKLAKLQPKMGVFCRLITCIQLWVLEDAEKHKWSSHIYALSLPRQDIVAETKLCFVRTTSRSEIVLAPTNISDSFYLLYYNPETNNITKVGIQGMEAFRSHRVYTFFDHVEDVKLMKNV